MNVVSGLIYLYKKRNKQMHAGQKVVIKEAGKDATDKFNMLHNQSVLKRYGEKVRGQDRRGVVG